MLFKTGKHTHFHYECSGIVLKETPVFVTFTIINTSSKCGSSRAPEGCAALHDCLEAPESEVRDCNNENNWGATVGDLIRRRELESERK